ncbi:hypothetical protein BDR26DRAFT_228061 [Obelidium mucronatum]|nr:hypothetical protein BDR26DRAFT_228061 [Obelidium mucronatum]
MTSTFIQFESNRIIHVILPRMQLAGSISPLLGNLEQMKILDLSENQLTGSIPPELAKCQALKTVVLEKNELSGVVPPQLLTILAANGAKVNFGVNCLDNAVNQKSSCKKKADHCLAVSLDTRYTTDAKFQPLWDALASVERDLNAFDRLAEISGNFAVGEYWFSAFRKYVTELEWCVLHHPELVYHGK